MKARCLDCNLPFPEALIQNTCTQCLLKKVPLRDIRPILGPPVPPKVTSPLALWLIYGGRIRPGGSETQKPFDRPAKKRRCNPNGKPTYVAQTGFPNPVRSFERKNKSGNVKKSALV